MSFFKEVLLTYSSMNMLKFYDPFSKKFHIFSSPFDEQKPPEGISDDLPDADLFQIQAAKLDDWYEQMLNYLTEGIFPEGMTNDHRRKLVLRSATYSIIGGYCTREEWIRLSGDVFVTVSRQQC